MMIEPGFGKLVEADLVFHQRQAIACIDEADEAALHLISSARY